MRPAALTLAMLCLLGAVAAARADLPASDPVPLPDAPAEAEAGDGLGAFAPAAPAPAEPLSLFQWSLKAEGVLLLVPVDGHLYPARRVGAGVIETRPPKLAVQLYHDGRELSVPLHAILAPQELGRGHVLEIRKDEQWVPLLARHFHGLIFYGQSSANGPFEPLALEAIRFRPR